jgi:hypothetical protein
LGATITDNNGCSDVSTVTTSLYRSSVTFASCDDDLEDDNNDCYAVISCSVVGAGNTCDGASDDQAAYTCTVAMQYHADPTDVNTTYEADNWLNTFVATDDDAASHTLEIGTGVEVTSLTAMDITAGIDYGLLTVGQANDPLDKTTTVTATGNVGLDEDLSGEDMTSGANSIAVSNQKYALTAATAYASGISLSAVATEAELNCSKTTVTGTPATKDTWWGLYIPNGTLPGDYSGNNTVTARKGEFADW